MSNVATHDSLIHRSDGGNVSDAMNTKFFPFKNQEGKVIKRGSADVHHVVTHLFFFFFLVWSTDHTADIYIFRLNQMSMP